ncbi:hypothetical protein COHA_002271 [Chlorella ohadii]|uniref:Uncharacterized protein n=1 Tax=Chlorella ohadii TaxID=2649997 RepID=A0AAD5DW25_9CHLO|nr:hypothetical protein COHA_002271 [Chlorella ohadii]
MEAAVDKMVAAQARLAAAGDSCPDLDHLLEAIAGVRRAEELIPANAMSGGGIALPKPMPNMPKSVPLFKGLFECVKAGTLGTGSIGYFTISPLLLDRLGTGLGPYAQMFESGGRKGFDCRDPSELEHMAAAGFFGSLSILQLLATSLLQVQLGGGERSKAAGVDRIGLVMKAVWGARPAHALKQRLERQHWVPRFPAAAAAAAAAGGRAQAAAAGTSPAEQAQRECQQGIMQDFEEYCGLEGQAALDAIWEAAATLRLAAVSSMQSPSKAQLQAALCDAQALLDRCTSTPATARHLTSLASAGTVAANLSQWLGLPLERRQALVALLEEALARADAQNCYTAPYICLVLSQFAAQMVQQGKQARGVGRMGAAEAAELEQRGRQLATAVSGYGPRIKPWLPGGLQPVYQGWVAAAAALGGPAPSRAQAGEGGSFPTCSSCASPALHLRRLPRAVLLQASPGLPAVGGAL